MGRMITGYAGPESKTSWMNDGVPIPITTTSGGSTQVILNSNEFPVKVTVQGWLGRVRTVNAGDTIYIHNNADSSGYTVSPNFFVKCDSDGGTSMTHSSPAWVDFVGTNLKGAGLCIRNTNSSSHYGAGKNQGGVWTINIYTHYAIEAPAQVTVPDTASGNVTLSWTASVAADGTVSSYEIQCRDRANSSESWGAWAGLTTSTGTSASVRPNTINGGQRQYRVRAIGTNAAYNSNWTESNICTSTATIVNAGDKITKSQFDALKAWRESQGLTNIPTVTQGNLITAIIGNAYKFEPTDLFQTLITATWYNEEEEVMTASNTSVNVYGLTIEFYKCGRLGFIYINGQTSSAISDNWSILCSIPAGYVPLHNVFIPIVSDLPYFYLNTSGFLQNSGTVASGVWVQGSMAYITAS